MAVARTWKGAAKRQLRGRYFDEGFDTRVGKLAPASVEVLCEALVVF